MAAQMYGQKPQNQLEVTAWADDGERHHAKVLTILLDDGAEKNCISEEFAHAIRATVQEEKEIRMTTAVGQQVEVLGQVRIGFSWKARSASRFARIKCYVVKDLQVAMLICSSIISKLALRDSPALLAPILLPARSKQVKRNDAEKSKQIADAAKEKERLEAERRKAERARMEQAANLRATQRKPQATADSPVGRSNTSVSSGVSSSSGFDYSSVTTAYDRSSTRATSIDSQSSKAGRASSRHRRSKAVTSFD
jgi:hypothetical protein